ncbi:hypothetical protein JTB14_006861 [Gonioctena quinquepunctata]|nr:hypothetical protein JTB14_006861 [Gonioctena quinquepunctata]
MQSSGYLRMKDKLDVIEKFVKIRTKCPKERTPELYKKTSLFFLDFKKKWQESNRTHDRFLTKNKNWLDVSISFPDYTNYSKKVGRAEITFEESADRTKRKKTEPLRTKYSPEELSFAKHMSLRSVCQVKASKVLKEVTATTPTRAMKYRTALKKYGAPKRKQLTGVEALAMVVGDKEAEFLLHTKRVSSNKFPCREPQRRVVYLRELVKGEEYDENYKKFIKDIRPLGTILNRCENNGCCKRYNERCQASKENDVDLTFLNLHGSSVKYFTITAKNHTKCACQRIGDDIIK